MAGNQSLYQQFSDALKGQQVTLGFTSCIGLADQGVGVLINGVAIPALDDSRAAQIINLINARRPLADWPGELFVIDDNIQRRDRQLGCQISSGDAIRRTVEQGGDWLLEQLAVSGLRGRGGAGFPTEKKWRLCRGFSADAHFVVCNADEGEPGTFKDRVLLNTEAEAIIEGMSLQRKHNFNSSYEKRSWKQ